MKKQLFTLFLAITVGSAFAQLPVSTKRIGGSSNVYSVLLTESRALTYNESVNTVGMAMRKQPGWTGVTGGNSGTVAYAYSTNAGSTWDSTIVVASSTNLMRYPCGTIYNPTGNTNPANAYAVVSGPWLSGAGWQGNFFASKQLSFPGNNTSGSAIFPDNFNLAATPGQVKQDFTRCDMQATTNGKVHVLGRLYGDANATTAAGLAFRGACLNTGTFNSGSFIWTVDSLKPSFKFDNAGTQKGYSQSHQAWSENGQIGYVIFDGVDANAVAGTSMNTFQPYVYKTTNSGATWSRFAPLFNFTSIPSISARTFAASNGVKKPFISLSEGSSATVDAAGNLHLLATFISSYSDNIDSLGYTYNVDFNTTWEYITDFNTTSNGQWCAFIIDSLHTSGPTAAESNWTSSAGGLAYDARLQISRTTNGMKLFYSWADSDPLTTGNNINTQPNIHMKAYDLATNMMTVTKDMSVGKAGAENNSYWFLTSPIVSSPAAGTWQVPTIYTASDDGSLNGDNPVSYYYMNDNTFAASDFNNLYFVGCNPAVMGINTSQVNVACAGLTNGSATAIPVGGTAPYTYTWTTVPTQHGATAINLGAGTYTVTVKDAALNISQAIVTIQVQAPYITSANNLTINSGSSVNLVLTSNVPSTFSWLAANNSNVTGESLTTQTLTTITNTLINTSTVSQIVTYTIIPTATSGTCAGTPQILSVTVNPPIISSGPCSPELFISEYVEGSGNNKAMEFYNPTATSISMNNYRLVRYANGSSIGTDSTDLVGTINSHSTFVIANGVGVTSGTTSTLPACSPVLQALAQQIDGAYPAPTFFNGDDAVVLVRKIPYARIDIFGKIGQQPTTAWSDVFPYDGTVGNWWTKDHSLQRKATINQGVITNPTLFNVTLEWDSLPNNNFSNLGIHACNCTNSNVVLTFTTSQQNVTCNGYNNGVASVTVTGGTPPYTYSWNTSPVQTTQTITGLSAGTYNCIVSDATLNTASASINITEPDPIYNVTANVITNGSCVGNASGSAQVSTPMGGTPPYTYIWSTSPPQTTQTVSGLANGTYNVFVSDANNCPGVQTSVVIAPINSITPPFYDSIQAASCSISHNGSIKLYNGSIIPINGNLPFFSEFYNGTGNDKAVEIYNPTNNVIDLHSIPVPGFPITAVVSLFNQSNATYTFPVGSIIQPYGTFVVAHPLANANILLKANATTSVIDGTSLTGQGTSSFGTSIIDLAYITTAQTNRRKVTINVPNATLTPTEWLSYPLTLANVGSHGTSTVSTYYEANTIIQWDVNANNQTGPSAFNLNPGTYGYTITDTITGCQYANQVIVPSLGLDQFNVNFSATQTLFTAPPFVAQFTNTTPSLSNYNFVWDFGDGVTLSSNNASVFHQYQYNGLYTVKLIATAISTLCKDTMIKTDYIYCTGGVSCNLTATITAPANTNVCAGDSILLTCTNSGSLTYQWYLNGTAISAAVANTYYATQSGNYQVAVTNSVCSDFSNQVTLTFNALPQAPVVTSTGNVTQCLGGTVVLNASPGYSSYLWSNGATSQSITVSGSGIYSVTGNNSFGCGTASLPYSLNFSAAPATPICLVTVDTTSLYNQVIWDKPVTAAIDSFRIYRETMTNVFSYLNSVAFTSLSIYNDYAANPNVTSYKYKISAVDTCGNETLLSNYHNTIHLQFLGSGNLQWTVYTIENELNPVSYYKVLRDDNSTGNFLPISSTIPGGNSTYTDINWASYPNAAYRVDVVWNRTCVPAKLTSTSKSISRSNVKHVQANSISNLDLSKLVSIYPNPASNIINVNMNTTLINNAIIELYDATGKLLTQQKVTNEFTSLNINGLSNGIYTVRIITDNEQTIKRIVKQQ